MANLKDLARRLNLSVTQVSRALNDHDDVSRTTKDRVRAAAAEIGYRPNLAARKLRSGRSGIVAMIVPGRSETVEIELLMETVMGLSAEFSRRGMQFVLHVLSPGEDAAEAHGRLIHGGSIDGLILTDPLLDDPRIAVLEASGTPFVVHGRDRPDAAYSFVDIDHRRIGRELAAALCARGCRRIALVDGPPDRPYSLRRRAGAQEALAAVGLSLDPALVCDGPMTMERGRLAAGRLGAAGIDGAFAGNMMLAAGLRDGLAAIPIAAHDDGLPRFGPQRIAPPLILTRAPLVDAWRPLGEGLTAALLGRVTQTMLDLQVPPGT